MTGPEMDPTLDGFGEIIADRYVITGNVGSFGGTSECDATDASYVDGHCRCIVCARCGHHTGNAHQGHYWAYCSATKTLRDFHLCCPDDCELEATT